MIQEDRSDEFKELLELTRENNRILRSMHRRMLWSQVFTIVYWCAILGVMTWSYYLVAPYMSQYWDMFQQLSTQMTALESSGIALPTDLKQLLEKVQ
jgi:predicted PurR-regulated permease PerM